MKEKDKSSWLVRTPAHIINLILDEVWYSWKSILNKTILDPAAWDWNFIDIIVKRIINEAKSEKIENKEILNIINNNVYAWELNKELLEKTTLRINKILNEFNISKKSIKFWNFKVVNSIVEGYKQEHQWKFDFVVWNPPYVRVQNLSENDRIIIKQNSYICSLWAIDLFIPFFEFWYALLNQSGKLSYITPNTLLKTKTALLLREFLLTKTKINKFIDFKEHQIFDATTYSLITIFSKRNKNDDNTKIQLDYSDEKLNIINKWFIDLESQSIKSWNLIDKSEKDIISNYENKGIKLWQLCKISAWLATLSDDLYMHKILNFNKDNKTQEIITKEWKSFFIETEMLKPIIKISRLKNIEQKQNLYIIFPYQLNEEGKNKIITETDMALFFPLTYAYFCENKKRLLARDKGKINKAGWYAFWRSQWLDMKKWKKIITSNINKEPNFMFIDNEETLFISWYILSIPDYLFDKTEILLDKLNSKEMNDYIQKTSRDYKGWYKGYSKAFIENFWIEI